MATRGYKSSERKALDKAFYAGIVLAAAGIWQGVDLVALAALITAVVSPQMVYATNRTWLKRKKGEK